MHLKQTYKDLYDSIRKTRVQIKDHNDLLIAQVNSKTVENVVLKAQIQEKVFANASLKKELRNLKGNSVDTKFAKPSILRKPALQPLKNKIVIRQPNAFKSDRPKSSKPRFASQVDVKHDLPKAVTPYYLPKVRESVFAKSHHVIAPGSSRNSSKESYGSNDMAHNYYLKEAKKKTQLKNRNLNPREMPSSRAHHTPNAFITKLRINNQTSRNWSASKSSDVTLKDVQKSDHSRNPRHRFSPNKSSVVHEKPSPRSCLRWKPTGRIFKTVGLRWIPTRKIFASSTTKVDSKPPHGSNADITNPHGCIQTLDIRPELQLMTPGTINFRLVQNPSSPTPYSIVSPVPLGAGGLPPRPVDPTDTPLSTSIEQDAPELSSQESSSIMQPTNPPFDHISKWMKIHPLENVISNPSRPVLT
ncbi:hypothetical protein Tco_0861798 [Tanacetum coccineum]